MLYRISSLGLLAAIIVLCGCDAGVQSKLQRFVDSEKANLPKVIDEFTTLVDLKSGELEIVYVYKISGLSDEDAESLKSRVESQARSQIMAKKEALKPLIESKIKMSYVYQNQAATELFRFSIEPWED